MFLAARGLRPSRSLLHRTTRFSRKYNGTSNAGGHTTYFQSPPQPPKPPRRILRKLFFGSTCIGLGMYAHSWMSGLSMLGPGIEILDVGEEGLPAELETLEDAMSTAVQAAAAVNVPPMDLARAQEVLETKSGYSVTPTAVGHTSQLPSNLPCEDTWSTGAFNYFDNEKKDWSEWAIFDGHAGPRTAQLLRQFLPIAVGEALWQARCLDRPYTPNDRDVFATIKRAFTSLDDQMINRARELVESGNVERSEIVAAAATVHSGSCALLALYDPKRSILRVANTGDSRAVLGTWSREEGKYVAKPMSRDQTGFNEDEVARLREDHPGEESVDPTTGRVHGIAVSRAFGDARWKWPNEITKRAHDFFWGPSPRPNGVIKTPPYLTAEPEVTETRIRTGARPDFLIMASDGLWDVMSNEDAVACVQLWLDKNKPTNFLEKQEGPEVKESTVFGMGKGGSVPLPFGKGGSPSFTSMSDLSGDDDTYFDQEEKCLKWRVSPKHFVNEDENCGIHLVKNALGGKRRDLFCGLMSLQPPLSRNVRDDITVHVIFFGVDTQDLSNN
ncbi:hypothetical protein KC367_g2783 [Hortaea werneckii]|nr:hypothetical protein KC367_g2783 [Hortaea werneckii]